MLSDIQLEALKELGRVGSFSLTNKKIGERLAPKRASMGLRQNPNRQNELGGRILLSFDDEVVSLPVELPRELRRKITEDVALNRALLDYCENDAAVQGLRFEAITNENGVFLHASEGSQRLSDTSSIPYTIYPAFAVKAHMKEDRFNGARDELQLIAGKYVRVQSLKDVANSLEIPQIYRLSADFGGETNVGWGLNIPKEGPIQFRDYVTAEAVSILAETIVSGARFMDPYKGITKEVLSYRTKMVFQAIQEIAVFRDEEIEPSYEDFLIEMALDSLLLTKEDAAPPPAKFIRVKQPVTITVEDEEDEVFF